MGHARYCEAVVYCWWHCWSQTGMPWQRHSLRPPTAVGLQCHQPKVTASRGMVTVAVVVHTCCCCCCRLQWQQATGAQQQAAMSACCRPPRPPRGQWISLWSCTLSKAHCWNRSVLTLCGSGCAYTAYMCGLSYSDTQVWADLAVALGLKPDRGSVFSHRGPGLACS